MFAIAPTQDGELGVADGGRISFVFLLLSYPLCLFLRTSWHFFFFFFCLFITRM